MRVGIVLLAACLLVSGCSQSEDTAAEVPPPPELSPASAGPPPPTVPPPLDRWFGPYPPGFMPPANAPSAEKCAQIRADREAERVSARAKERREYVPHKFIPFAERKQHPMRGGFAFRHRLTPTLNGFCKFSEKPRGSVPADYMLSASDGNIDLWEAWDTLLHDHAIGFVESSFASGKVRPVIAVRQDLPDLWIGPVGDDVILYIGPERFECRRQPEN